jgi:ribose 5-phosphate isomerase B
MEEDDIRTLVRRAVQRSLVLEGNASESVTRRYGSSGRKLVTEADLEEVASGSRVEVPVGALVTPLARDLARDRGIQLVPEAVQHGSRAALGEPSAVPSTASAAPDRTVALAADHGGFELKEKIKAYLHELGYGVLDCGTSSSDSVDYPDFAYAAARLVSEGRATRGIVIDGAGIGSCMAANKVPGIRAALCYDLSTAVNSREHNDANVLTLGGRLIGDVLAREIVKRWLGTPFGGDRHARRVDKIMAIERRYLKQ